MSNVLDGVTYFESILDTVGDTLGATTQWIKQQQELLGQNEDLLGDMPPVALEVNP